jgi:hypothetical protein
VTSLEHGLNNRDNHERIIAELTQSIDIAADLGVRGLIAFSGNRRAGLTDAEGARITVEGLSKIAPYAERKKVYVNLELSELEGRPYRLPVRPDGLGHRGRRAGCLSVRPHPVRHLPHADHGGRRDPHASGTTFSGSGTFTRRATPGAGSWATTRS